jgi:hypothetical protein
MLALFSIHLPLSAVTELTRSLISSQLSQAWVKLPGDCVNAEWDSTPTESTWNDENFLISANYIKKTCKMLTSCSLSRRVVVVSLHVDSVDVRSYSVLTPLTGSLTPHWLSVRKMN